MNLFNVGAFKLHSGESSDYKVDCDFLSDQDIAALAAIIAARTPPFAWVEGVARGGLQLAAELEPYSKPTDRHNHLTRDIKCLGVCPKCDVVHYDIPPLGLIVDDVLTSGASMEEHRAGRELVTGVVLFARGPLPSWIRAVWEFGLND